MNRQVVVRFPPSPTGEWHFGNVRTFVFNYLFAKQNNGKIVLRFEDTDVERNKADAEQSQIEILKTLGLEYDEGPYRQSERKEIYKKFLREIIDLGFAYEAEENENKTGKLIRLKNPNIEIVWNDLVKGELKINTDSFKDANGNTDFIIARSIDDPLYHFAVVVDDFLMGVTHILRGEDHVTSTPRQILIFRSLEHAGARIPEFGHFPTILGENKKKLGKRNGAIPVREYLELGYLPVALLNAITLLGWNPGDDSMGEIFTKEELIKYFSLEKVQTSPAVFSGDKLDFINKQHLNKLSDEEFVEKTLQYFTEEEKELINYNLETNKKVILKVLRERISKFSEVTSAYRTGEVNMFFKYLYKKDLETFDVNKMCFKEETLEVSKNNLKTVLEKIENIDEADWNTENLKKEIWDWSGTVGRGGVLHPLRMIMSLKDKSPDPFTIMEIIGKEESIKRIKYVTNS